MANNTLPNGPHTETRPSFLHLSDSSLNDNGKEAELIVPNTDPSSETVMQQSNSPLGELRQNLFLVSITLTQLVQMIPLGVGINSGLALGEAMGASGVTSVWIVASYPLTQGSFVLIGVPSSPSAW